MSTRRNFIKHTALASTGSLFTQGVFSSSLSEEGDGAVVTKKPRHTIVPVALLPWKVALVKGQDSPYVQSWFSDTYNNRIPAYCAEYRTTAVQYVETFAWVLYPNVNETIPLITTKVLSSTGSEYRFQINIPGEEPTEVAINLDAVGPIELTDGSRFSGRCVIVQKAAKPIVIHGMLVDKDGKVYRN